MGGCAGLRFLVIHQHSNCGLKFSVGIFCFDGKKGEKFMFMLMLIFGSSWWLELLQLVLVAGVDFPRR
jgi:hypothetical protein